MIFDALTMAAVAAELRQALLGGRVQRIVQTAPLSFGWEIYAQRQRYYLLTSAHPSRARVHLTSDKPTRDPQASSPLLLHLRRRVRGAILEEVQAPPLERILFLHFVQPRLPLQEQRNTLVVEVMGRHSNLILLDQQEVVLDCVKRVTPQMSSVRPMLPHHSYQPPPRPVKADPRRTNGDGVARALAGLDHDLPVWQALVHVYLGVSPQLAREIVHRACGQAGLLLSDPCPSERLAEELADFWVRPEEDRWEPCMILLEGQPVGAAPYRITHRLDAEIERVPTIGQALDQAYSAQQSLSRHEQSRQLLLRAVEQRRDRLNRRLAALNRELAQAGQVEELRQKGEWVLACQAQLAPGESLLQVEGLQIELDPQLGAVENAQAYFASYRKAKQAGLTLPHKIAETGRDLDWLDEMTTLLLLAESYDELASLATELEQAAIRLSSSRVPRRKAALLPRTFRSTDGLVMLVGRNARQNEELSLRRARPHDLWFHARGRPGAHVIVQTEGRPVPQTTLREAASLAAYYSQGRGEHGVAVDYTECRYVRSISTGRPGLVRYSREQTLHVAPERPPEIDPTPRPQSPTSQLLETT